MKPRRFIISTKIFVTLVWTNFLSEKGRKHDFIAPLRILSPNEQGTGENTSASHQQNKLCSSRRFFSRIKGLFLRPQALSDHEGQCSISEWTMANENEVEDFKTYFSAESKKQKSHELILLPSNFISFLNCFAQPLMVPGLPYIWRLSSSVILVFNWSSNYGRAVSAYSVLYI